MDEGPCPKVHSAHLKEAFEKHNDPYMYDNIVEREFTARLNEADRIIKVWFYKGLHYVHIFAHDVFQ